VSSLYLGQAAAADDEARGHSAPDAGYSSAKRRENLASEGDGTARNQRVLVGGE
jgi:hypothetical protein